MANGKMGLCDHPPQPQLQGPEQKRAFETLGNGGTSVRGEGNRRKPKEVGAACFAQLLLYPLSI